MADGTGKQSGFECEFVEAPPKVIQSECPVCLQVLREPYQTTCCGKSYCRVCVEQLKASRNSCPCCKKPINDFPYIGLQQSLYDFKVYCSNKGQGCRWTGELRALDKHLNDNPPQEKQLEGCQYTTVLCIYCHSKHGQRSDIKIHQRDECPKRPFKCTYCKSYDSYYEDVTTKHWRVCDYYPQPCPNQCGAKFSRQSVRDLQSHISNDCPLALIDCDFKRVGCEVKLLRKDAEKHYSDNCNVAKHISLLAEEQTSLAERLETSSRSYGRQLLTQQVKSLMQVTTQMCDNTATHMKFTAEILQEKKWEKEKERHVTDFIPVAIFLVLLLSGVVVNPQKSELRRQVALLTQELQTLRSHASICPLNITFPRFEQHRKNNDIWYSPPFYTYPKGYKMCLKVCANGCGKGNGEYVSVIVYLMQGQFDDELKWPFRGGITVKLLNQQDGSTDDGHELSRTYHFSYDKSECITNRVVDGEVAEKGLGSLIFASHTVLKHQYLKNNQLKFLVKYSGLHIIP